MDRSTGRTTDRTTGLTTPGVLITLLVILGLAAAVVAVITHDPAAERGSGLGEEFEYDLKALRVIDPALVRYAETGSFTTGFAQARALAVGPDDGIYVAGDRAVRGFDPAGARSFEIAIDGEPVCLAVAPDGGLVIAQRSLVECYSPAGARSARWNIPGRKPHVTSVAVSRDTVFVADAGNRVVLVFTAAGEFVRRIGEKDAGRDIPGLLAPSPYLDLALAPDGLLRVVNPGRHSIEAYTLEGELELSWGKPGSAIDRFIGCCNPAHFALLPDGGFVTSEKGLVRIKTFSPDGAFAAVVAGPDRFKDETGAVDVAADSKGRIVVLDPSGGAVRVFTKRPEGAAGEGTEG